MNGNVGQLPDDRGMSLKPHRQCGDDATTTMTVMEQYGCYDRYSTEEEDSDDGGREEATRK